jgi:hypothetical protein
MKEDEGTVFLVEVLIKPHARRPGVHVWADVFSEAYSVAYAYPSWRYGYYPRSAYYGYAYAPGVRYGYYPRRAYGAYAYAPGWRYRRWERY